MTTVNAIQWPEKWIPGETDNFVSNEVIVKGLDFNKVVQHLRDASHWESITLGEMDMAAVYHYLEKGEH